MPAENHLWDVIVVGAGPAGCAAAYDLAAAGHSVLLLDKQSFPRLKACAGGLTMKAVRALRYSIDPVVKEVVRRVQLQGPQTILLKAREPICVMTVRAELDAYCLGKTMAAGAVFQKISALRSIARSADAIEIVTIDEHYRARFVVGADGASGQVRQLCGSGTRPTQGFALEVQTALPPDPTGLVFDFGAVPNGYGWIFPKRDHLNIGLYVQSSAATLKRSQLLAYVKQKVGTVALHPVTGQYLGVGAGGDPGQSVLPELRNRVFLVGDAGGFVDGLTGEGIYGALLSGQAAAQAIRSELHGKGPAIQAFATHSQSYRQTLRFSARAAAAFYANPSRGFRAMRLPFLQGTLIKTYTHGLKVDSLPVRLALSRC